MKIKALVPFSNGAISMEQYEVREVADSLGNELISAGVAVEIGGGSGGGVLVVHDDRGILDKTWQEIHDAMLVGGVVLSLRDTRAANISGVDYNDLSGSYVVSWYKAGEFQIGTYTASSADDYPTEG